MKLGKNNVKVNLKVIAAILYGYDYIIRERFHSSVNDCLSIKLIPHTSDCQILIF